jgi:carbon-monoxide dehydrogenase small subunit
MVGIGENGVGDYSGGPAVSEPAAQGLTEQWPTVGLTLRVDGQEYPVPQVWIGDSLLAVLRERLDLEEPRDGCGVGECGACLVTVDDSPAAACLVPAVAAVARDVRTPRDPAFGAARAAVAAAGASPCGFCAPGLAVAITTLLRRNLDPGPAAVREALSGVICRCSESGTWIEAVALAKEAEAGADRSGAEPDADPDSDAGPAGPAVPQGPAFAPAPGGTPAAGPGAPRPPRRPEAAAP